MVTDPISDILIQIKNAAMVKKPTIAVPHSKLKMAIVKVLQREGYLSAVSRRGKKAKRTIVCDIAYGEDGQPVMNQVRRVSKPSRRIYKGVNELRSVRQGLGLSVLSTPKGILTDREARRERVGGEVLFLIW